MELILQRLKSQTTRNTTTKNYHTIWKGFNKFILRLDKIPETWEGRLCLYGAFLVEKGIQSSTLKSYFSAIKKVLVLDGYKFSEEQCLLNSLSKACHLQNDQLRFRLPICHSLLEIILFELERMFPTQYYLEILYKTIIIIAYYGLFRIGELAMSQHSVRACNVNAGKNKNKILIVLYSSKTHLPGTQPQKIKIAEV